VINWVRCGRKQQLFDLRLSSRINSIATLGEQDDFKDTRFTYVAIIL